MKLPSSLRKEARGIIISMPCGGRTVVCSGFCAAPDTVRSCMTRGVMRGFDTWLAVCQIPAGEKTVSCPELGGFVPCHLCLHPSPGSHLVFQWQETSSPSSFNFYTALGTARA